MKLFDKTITLLFLAAMLASCNSFQSTPTLSQADIMQTAISTVSTALAETRMAIPTNTPLPTVSFRTRTPLPPPTLGFTSTPLGFSDPSIPLPQRIVYYYFVTPAENPIPEGTVRGLAPTYADETYTSDIAADLKTALEIVLRDGRNYWRGNELEAEIETFMNENAYVSP